MSTLRQVRAALLVAFLFVGFQAGAAMAQDTEDPILRRAIVWTNPILFVFTWYMAEVEIRLVENHTVGVGGSFLQADTDSPGDPDYEENQYFSVNAFYRYYPTASFRGFFIGVQAGAAEVSHKENELDIFGMPTGATTDESGSAFSAGVLIGYGWLLGDAQRIGVSLGIGANRFFGGDIPEDSSATLPVIRLINVGIAF
jgi:hypothetical protein